MKRRIALLAAIAFCAAGSAYAIYEVYDRGAWPQSWPKELEPLRKQARTLVGPEVLNRITKFLSQNGRNSRPPGRIS